jgi:hypothetical protein
MISARFGWSQSASVKTDQPFLPSPSGTDLRYCPGPAAPGLGCPGHSVRRVPTPGSGPPTHGLLPSEIKDVQSCAEPTGCPFRCVCLRMFSFRAVLDHTLSAASRAYRPVSQAAGWAFLRDQLAAPMPSLASRVCAAGAGGMI